jgi:hypothetical protein
MTDPSSKAREQVGPPSAAPPAGSRRRATAPRRHSAGLNARQQQYLTTLFGLDQQAEREQRRRWHQQLRRDPAEHWRWIPYDTEHPAAGPSPAQQSLAQQGLQDPGAGSTLAALARRGLIQTRRISVESPTGTVTQIQVRLTTAGRAAAREISPPPSTDTCEQLPVWLHQALLTVAEAPPEGIPKTRIGRVAARRLGSKGKCLIEDASVWSYRLTEEGRAYVDRQRN